MRQIPFKNYIILGMILIISVFLSIVMMNLFSNYRAINEDNGFKNKINFDELELYLLENPDFIIYLADDSIEKSIFERKFKKFIINHDLANKIIYINLNGVSEKDFSKFVSKYSTEQTNTQLANCIIIIDSQKIVSVIYINPELDDLSNLKEVFKAKGVL